MSDIRICYGSLKYSRKVSQKKVDECKDALRDNDIFYATDDGIFCSQIGTWLSPSKIENALKYVIDNVKVSGYFLGFEGAEDKDYRIMISVDRYGLNIQSKSWGWKIVYYKSLPERQLSMKGFCMPIGKASMTWRRTPTKDFINDLNEILSKKNLLIASESGVSTTFLYDWEDWTNMLSQLEAVADYLNDNRLSDNPRYSLKGGLSFLFGHLKNGNIVGNYPYGQKFTIRGGKLIYNEKGKIVAVRKRNRKKK